MTCQMLVVMNYEAQGENIQGRARTMISQCRISIGESFLTNASGSFGGIQGLQIFLAIVSSLRRFRF